MREVSCAHCGAMMPPDEACPVCELPAAAGPTDVPLEPSPLARWWRNGQLSVGAAVALFLTATFVPLLTRVPVVLNRVLDPNGALTPLDLALGSYAPLRGTMTAWMLPGAAVFLASLLRTRRTAGAMRASRMLVAVVALAPMLSAVMPIMKLKRRGLEVGVGPAMALIVVGVCFGLAGALRFGHDAEGQPDAEG